MENTLTEVERLLDEAYLSANELTEHAEGIQDAYVSLQDMEKNPWPVKEYETASKEFFDTFETNKAEIKELVEELQEERDKAVAAFDVLKSFIKDIFTESAPMTIADTTVEDVLEYDF